MKCPMCEAEVTEFKTNCHVIPRAFIKTIKQDGRNILLDFKNDTIAINQKDYKDDYWCATCEEESAKDDSYGAAVLLHRTEAEIVTKQGRAGLTKRLTKLDVTRFKRFVLSIPIRDFLARKLNGESTLFDEEIFSRMRSDYFGKSNTCGITGLYMADDDPISRAIHAPVLSRKADGVNFQLLNFNFLVYFEKQRPEVQKISLTDTGELFMIVREHEETGSHRELKENYQKILDNDRNSKTLRKISDKYDPEDAT